MMIQSVPGNLFQAFHHPEREQAFIPIDHVNHAVLEIDFQNRVIYMVNGDECLLSFRMMKGLK